jgi:oxygen-independent coproporphyrinogen-3 oxidase
MDKQVLMQPLRSIYFGGGTPSLMHPDELAEIMTTIKTYYSIDNDTEISLECDPNTFDNDKLSRYLELGVNRVSLGIQTLNDNTLKKLGRSHDLKDIWAAIEMLSKQAPLKNLSRVSFDLIMGLPEETTESWEKTLKEVLQLDSGHLSVYFLAIEQNTPYFDKLKYREGLAPLPNSDDLLRIYNDTCKITEAKGYKHYEISSYAKSEATKSQHNQMYWVGDEPFFGFGMGAASFVDEVRYTRPQTLKSYFSWVEQLQKEKSFDKINENNKGNINREKIGSLNWLKSVVLGRLRTSRGINLEELAAKIAFSPELFVKKMLEFVAPYEGLDWVILTQNPDGHHNLALDPTNGFLCSDEVISRLFLYLENWKELNSALVK